MESDLFDISFTFDNQEYKGWVHPSDKLNESGVPASFHVVINETSFGNLSFSQCKWAVDEQRPSGLTKLIGREIEKHYKL